MCLNIFLKAYEINTIVGTVGEHREELKEKATGTISRQKLEDEPDNQPSLLCSLARTKSSFIIHLWLCVSFRHFEQSYSQDIPQELRFSDRNRRPPKDRFNSLLGFGYALLMKDVMNAILTVGLEPAFGFYHQPRSQAAPLALDLIEIFRVPLVDMAIMASINRGQWDVQADFEVRGEQVWLSETGKRKFVELYERRKQETWKHPITGYSLTYRRLMELEVRLLEKEWSGEGGLFAQLILR
ncbi:CRISPR-associated endonuclease Cas1 [Scytonema sp. NUACC21]